MKMQTYPSDYVDHPFKSPAVLSLCTGMRGLERGLERAIGPTRTVAYVEIEAFIIENLVRQMEQGVLAPTPVWTNLKTFPAEQFHNKIHGITGGYPCQPFSVAGKRAGTEDPRHLWPSILSIIRATNPI
jgi:DNA (cytosine-5)-methyltransferase 1